MRPERAPSASSADEASGRTTRTESAGTGAGCAGAPWAWTRDAGIAAAASPAPPAGLTARDFAREPAIQGLSISPSGKNLVGIVSPDGDTRYIAIWETANPGKAPVILGAQKMRLMSARFIKDDRLAVVAQQLFTVGTRATHLQKIYITDLKGEKWTPAIPDQKASSEQEEFANKTSNPSIVSILPNDPKHILVIDNRLGVTFVLIEHNLEMVMRLCGRVLVMAHGRVLVEGSPDAVRADPRVVEAYLGGAPA